MNTLFEQYAILEAEIAERESKKDALRSQILKQMVEQGADKIDVGVGKFSITKLKRWTYPEPVVELGEEFKAAKAKAESTGEATYVESDSLRFTAVKL